MKRTRLQALTLLPGTVAERVVAMDTDEVNACVGGVTPFFRAVKILTAINRD